MIGSIRGRIVYKGGDRIEIEANGVGWEVFFAQRGLSKVTVNQEVKVFTFHHLGEGVDALYGFLSRKDKRVFERLISVSGVGPKTAMAVFDLGNGERILQAVSEADVGFFQQTKGLGRKGAQRIIVDLKPKVENIKKLDLEGSLERREAIYQALRNLGFTKKEILQSLKDLPKELKSEDKIIKYALRKLGGNG